VRVVLHQKARGPTERLQVISSRHVHEQATPASAILLVLAVGVLFSFLDTSAKYLVLSGMAAPFVSWVRFATHVIIVLVLFGGWRNPAMFRVVNLPAQILRGLFLFGSTIFNFMALKTLQLAETTSIFFFAPMVITALAGPLLGGWAGWRRWLVVFVGFCGVLVITRPGVGVFGLGHAYALCGMFSYCFYVIMTRRMAAKETPESLIFYSALAPVILMLPTVPYTAWLPSDLFHWLILASLGVYGAFGHWLLIRAYRLATTSALAPYPYLQMVWMIFFGYQASGLYIVHREHRLRLKSSTAPNSEDEELAKKL
jgi:drug/metabolite transporter (DMT)-like permease